MSPSLYHEYKSVPSVQVYTMRIPKSPRLAKYTESSKDEKGTKRSQDGKGNLEVQGWPRLPIGQTLTMVKGW